MAMRRDLTQTTWESPLSVPPAVDTSSECATETDSSQPALQHNISQIRTLVGAVRPQYLKSMFVEGDLARLHHYAVHYPRTFRGVVNEALKEAGLDTASSLPSFHQPRTSYPAASQYQSDLVGRSGRFLEAQCGTSLTPLSTVTPPSGDSDAEEDVHVYGIATYRQTPEIVWCSSEFTPAPATIGRLQSQTKELLPEHSHGSPDTRRQQESKKRCRSSSTDRVQGYAKPSASPRTSIAAANVASAQHSYARRTFDDSDDDQIVFLRETSIASTEVMTVGFVETPPHSDTLLRPSQAAGDRQTLGQYKSRSQHDDLRFYPYEPQTLAASTYQLCFPCPDLCSVVFTSRAELKKHVRATHEQVERWGCKHCSDWVSFRPGQFTRHHSTHRCTCSSKSQRSTDHPCIRPHVCNSDCGDHPAPLPPRTRWACCVCDEVFWDSGRWLTHFIAHFESSLSDDPQPSFDVLMQNLISHSPFVTYLTAGQIKSLRFQRDKDSMFLQRVLEADLYSATRDWKHPVEWTRDNELMKIIFGLVLQYGEFGSHPSPAVQAEITIPNHSGLLPLDERGHRREVQCSPVLEPTTVQLQRSWLDS